MYTLYIFREMSGISIVKCDTKSEETDIEYYNKETRQSVVVTKKFRFA